MRIPSHVKLYLVGAKWCGACRPAFNHLVADGWPVEYLDVEEADHLRIPPTLPVLIIQNLHAERVAIGPDVAAMKETLVSFFGPAKARGRG